MKAGTVSTRSSGLSTGLAAATYTLVAGTQKAMGFVLLIAFTRLLTPQEYGEIALLTTVGALLMMAMTLGLEPRIMYAYHRFEDDLASYLRTAERVSIVVPAGVAVVLGLVIIGLPLDDSGTWIMECTGACLLAAGTTYPYAILRSARRAVAYAAFAVGLLATQVIGRTCFVAVLDWGSRGWAVSDLVTGFAAVVAGPLLTRRLRRASSGHPNRSPASVLRNSLPLVPHYLAQWGLSLSDRLILAAFVTTSAVGVYSAIYQIAAVISLMLSEVNRAFMPSYAAHEPGAPAIAPLVRRHLSVTFALYGLLFLAGFAAIELVFPPEYSDHAELYPALALGALVYGLYFLPMNGLTLIAGVTDKAPAISLSALATNVVLNLALVGTWGVWAAVMATAVGYGVLTALAAVFCNRWHAIRWSDVARHQAPLVVSSTLIIGLSGLATWPGAPRVIGVAGLGLVVLALGVRVSTDTWRGRRTTVSAGAQPSDDLSVDRSRGKSRDVRPGDGPECASERLGVPHE